MGRIFLIAAAGVALLPITVRARLQSQIRFQALAPIGVAAGTAASLQAFTLADVNKDGRPDLIVIDRQQDRIGVQIGHGDGTFAGPQFYSLDATPSAVAVADVSSPFTSTTTGDIDGNPDIIVADEDGLVTVLLGRGDGGFDPPEQDFTDVLDSTELHGVVVADFDHNGRLDLALLDTLDEVFFLCNVAGSFSPCLTDVIETMGSNPIAIVGGDFDGDSHSDIAVLNQDSHDLSPIFGNGDGSFVPVAQTVPTSAAGDQEPRDLAVGRFDADANDDVIVGNFEQSSGLELTGLYGMSNRTFGRRAFPAPFGLAAIAAADFNVDGAQDVLIVVGDTMDSSALSFGDGMGGLTTPIVPSGFPQQALRAVSISDLNGDGKPDVALLSADGSTIQIALNVTPALCPGDCNGDGEVSIDELVLAVTIALGEQPVSKCLAADVDGSNTIQINELVAAVAHALNGCS